MQKMSYTNIKKNKPRFTLLYGKVTHEMSHFSGRVIKTKHSSQLFFTNKNELLRNLVFDN